MLRIENDGLPEEWAIIDAFPLYSVSTFGRVRNDKSNRILMPLSNNRDVLLVNLSKHGYSVSRPVKKLVAEAFIPKPPFFERKRSCIIRHIDENWLNCRADNLNYTLRSDAAWIKRVGVAWGRPVVAVHSGKVYRDPVDAAKDFLYGDDIAIQQICMEADGYHCNETFRWAT